MPATNNQLVRYLILDRLFRNPHGHYRFWDLYNEVNEELRSRGFKEIKDRILHEDIRIMQSEDEGFGVKLKHWFEGRERIYQYEDLDYSILNQKLTPSQAKRLGQTIQMLSHFQGLPNYKWLDQTLVLLREEFQVDNAGEGCVHFSQCDELVGLDWFTPLYDTLRKQQVIEVTYHRFGKPSRQRVVHPYQLKQYNNRWYLVGYEERLAQRCKYVVLALDRMEDFRVREDVEYKPANMIAVENYYKNIIGVSRLPEGWPETVKVKAYYPAAHYLGTKPLHGSQTVVGEVDGQYKIFQWKVMQNEELVQQLIVYADQIEVLQGDWVRDKLRERAEKIIENMRSQTTV